MSIIIVSDHHGCQAGVLSDLYLMPGLSIDLLDGIRCVCVCIMGGWQQSDSSSLHVLCVQVLVLVG
jgi:hypothetical protein